MRSRHECIPYAQTQTRNWPLLSRWLVMALVLVLGVLLFRTILVTLETLALPPTSLQVTLTDGWNMAIQPAWSFEATPAVRTLYFVMRTRENGNYVGGCKVLMGLGAAGTERKGIHYHVTFLRGTTSVLDANLVPECYRFYLTETDEWYRLGLTEGDAPRRGAYRADASFVQAFRDATQLAWPPPY